MFGSMCMHVHPLIHSFTQHSFIEHLLSAGCPSRHTLQIINTAYMLSKSDGMLLRVMRVMGRAERRGGSNHVLRYSGTQGRHL